MRWFASHTEVVEAESAVRELGSLVNPDDKARAVAGGCAVKIVSALVAMNLFVFAIALGLLLSETVHWSIALGAGILSSALALLLPVGVANAAIRALYLRAARKATSTPRLGSVSSGSSTAIPSIESARGNE